MMNPASFFPQRPDSHPMIYAYEDTNPQYKGLLKIGFTSIDVDKRVAQQYPTKRPDGSVPYRIVYRENAMHADGSSFTDHEYKKWFTTHLPFFEQSKLIDFWMNDNQPLVQAFRKDFFKAYNSVASRTLTNNLLSNE